ncbi:MAG: hypothetical protein FWC67_01165 [Defluviitaleaceae bacterium]|nr:hypothetical protein [Defluviitaleaceae bacterium]
MKAEYDIANMKRLGHPLRGKVQRGEIELINPFDTSGDDLFFSEENISELRRRIDEVESGKSKLIERELIEAEDDF